MQIPPPYDRMARLIQERESAVFICELTRGFRRVLNVGPSWGRDFYALTAAGHDVVNVDIAPQAHLPRLALGNITHAVPFASKSFDAVLMAEVLEHLWDDGAALREARRLLTDDGILIVTVPFYNDLADYHVRIHSPATIRRLLQANGFMIVEYIERGGLIRFPIIIGALRKIVGLMVRRDVVGNTVIRVDRWLGRRRSWLLRRSQFFGCYVVGRKAAAVDFEHLNVNEFSHRGVPT